MHCPMTTHCLAHTLSIFIVYRDLRRVPEELAKLAIHNTLPTAGAWVIEKVGPIPTCKGPPIADKLSIQSSIRIPPRPGQMMLKCVDCWLCLKIALCDI